MNFCSTVCLTNSCSSEGRLCKGAAVSQEKKYQIWTTTGIFMVFNWVIIGRQIKVPTLEE